MYVDKHCVHLLATVLLKEKHNWKIDNTSN